MAGKKPLHEKLIENKKMEEALRLVRVGVPVTDAASQLGLNESSVRYQVNIYGGLDAFRALPEFPVTTKQEQEDK